MQLFYVPDIASNPVLPEEESKHCVRVLRLGENAEVLVTDGKGFFYKAIILSPHPKHCALQIRERWAQPALWPFHLHIAVAPTKNIDRLEWFVEKATEIGVDAITFLNCRFSERREVKLERMEKILISAMKQSQKARLPRLEGMVDFQRFVERSFNGKKMIAHCGMGEKPLIKEIYRPSEDVLFLIGPEGDFSAEEIALSAAKGFLPVSLGKSRLRTETAALTVCQTIHILSQ